MKVLLVNGSPHLRGCVYTALHEMAVTFEKLHVDAEILQLGGKPVADCIACGYCGSHGHCVNDKDPVNRVIEQLDELDGLVVGSPVYYGGPNGQITSFMDRLFYAAYDRLAGKVGAAVVSCRRGGATAAFDRLNKYFLMSNMIVPGSQYWNQIHGFTAEDALKDKEGLQTMRTLAQNIAWILSLKEAGRKAGVPDPVYEPWIGTHFIQDKY
jgi:multimeric flavodoxin WrbA